MVLFLGIAPPSANPGVCPSGQHLDSQWEGASLQWSASFLLGGALPLSGSCPLGWETALATVTTSPIFQGCVFLFPLVSYVWLAAQGEPTPCYRDAYSVDTPGGHYGRKAV